MIIPGHRNHPAPWPGSGKIGVLEHIAGAIHPWGLAVPEPEHAVIARTVKQIDLLRAPDRRCGQVLVQALLKHHLGGR